MKDYKLLIEWIEYYRVVPISCSCNLDAWNQNPRLSFYGNADSLYKKAVETVKRSTVNLSYEDIVTLMSDAKASGREFLWFARRPGHYLDDEQSFHYVDMLLQHQYGEEVGAFVKRLYNVCERIEPKRNTLVVTGPANCGKTWFFDMICAFYLNVGHIKNMVRGEHFPLNDAPNCRLLMWNEASIMNSAFDYVKMLLGGDDCPVNVKYQGGVTIPRTPVIMTGNKDVIPQQTVWTTRCYKDIWKQAPFLKTINAKPSPWAYVKLVEKYIK